LCWIYDDNKITIEGHTDLAYTEDVPAKFRACGWHVQIVEDANDFVFVENGSGLFVPDDRDGLIAALYSIVPAESARFTVEIGITDRTARAGSEEILATRERLAAERAVAEAKAREAEAVEWWAKQAEEKAAQAKAAFEKTERILAEMERMASTIDPREGNKEKPR
jgi:transketolase